MFVVFDLDGTLADLEHRKPLLENKDWRGFFAAVGGDTPIEHAIDVLTAMFMSGHRVEIWSGRSDECREATEMWLRQHGVPPCTLIMRTEGDYRPDDEVKRDFLRGTDWPDLIFDDRDRVVAMWRSLGIPCFQVAPGAF